MLKALKDAEKLLVKKDDVKEDEDKNPDSQKGSGSSDRRSDTDHVLGVHAGSFRSCYFQKKKKSIEQCIKKSAQDNQILCADEEKSTEPLEWVLCFLPMAISQSPGLP